MLIIDLFYRMYPAIAVDLINLIQPYLPNNHPARVPAHLQTLLGIRFLAEGGYQKGVGTDRHHPMSQSSISRYLHHVITAINRLGPRFIQFPSTEQRRNDIQRGYIKYKFLF